MKTTFYICFKHSKTVIICRSSFRSIVLSKIFLVTEFPGQTVAHLHRCFSSATGLLKLLRSSSRRRPDLVIDLALYPSLKFSRPCGVTAIQSYYQAEHIAPFCFVTVLMYHPSACPFIFFGFTLFLNFSQCNNFASIVCRH